MHSQLNNAVKTITPLSESLKQGYTLPASWYTSRDAFEAEKELIFNRSWSYAGRIDQIPLVGDYLTCKVGAVPIIVLRDETQQIKAYVNVCKHRGAEIVLDGSTGNRKTLQCHYHAWTWGLDGCLKSAPLSQSESCFSKGDYPLTSARVGILGSFIFVNPHHNTPSWEETIGHLPQIIHDSGLKDLRYRERRVYDMKCNWKVVVENFLECYHCPISHRGFSNLIDLNEYTVHPFSYFSVQRGPLKDSAKKSKDAKQFNIQEGSTEGIYNYLWPHFMVNTYPGPGNASTNTIVPMGPNHTLAIYEFYLDDKIPEDEAKKIVDFIDQVQLEDITICESVQRGLESGFYQQGKLILSKENGIQHFQGLVHSALKDDARMKKLPLSQSG